MTRLHLTQSHDHFPQELRFNKLLQSRTHIIFELILKPNLNSNVMMLNCDGYFPELYVMPFCVYAANDQTMLAMYDDVWWADWEPGEL